jgi:hypothetical protein
LYETVTHVPSNSSLIETTRTAWTSPAIIRSGMG